MWKVSIVYSLIIFYLFSVGYCLEDCELGWTGPDCKFKCHCGNGTGCNADGTCQLNQRCDKGFFGFACQYVDMVDVDHWNVLNDNDDSTCIKDKSQKVFTLKAKPHRFTFLEVVFTSNEIFEFQGRHYYNLETFEDFKVELKNNDRTIPCPSKKLLFVNSKVLQIHCDTITSNVNKFVFTGDLITHLCDVHSGGGRNVALKAKVNASTVLPCSRVDAVTDGKDAVSPLQFDNQICYHSDFHDPKPTISVILDSDYHVQTIRLSNRQGALSARMKFFQLITLDASNKYVLSYENDQGTKPAYIVNHPLKQPIRVIRMYLFQPGMVNEGSLLNLCEMEVFGDCPKTRYGLNCSDTCSSNCKFGQCNMYGICYECIDRYYDYFCSKSCPSNCLNQVCERNSGTCIGGCKSGYYGPTCETAS